jgi:hypothetical protein
MATLQNNNFVIIVRSPLQGNMVLMIVYGIPVVNWVIATHQLPCGTADSVTDNMLEWFIYL